MPERMMTGKEFKDPWYGQLMQGPKLLRIPVRLIIGYVSMI
ncbi:hypothetical protein [Oceanobacillus sp. J11TS1]|nr:hypothetical protein [Oceanobacillus sp. J11TS1]GIO24816.1 hypothetical protein J11TS1_33970 [Oceanobacillus sp. J11TS1]